MTTAEALRSTVARAACDVPIAGVPWPAYKVFALFVGLVVLIAVGLATTSAAAAVLAAAAAGAITWVGLRFYCASCR